jgi:uncharacterized membrane protein YhfC
MLEMITNPTFISYIVAAVATILLPVVLIVWLGFKRKIHVEPTFYGIVEYLISQLLLQSRLLDWVSWQDWFVDLENSRTTLLLILIAVCMSAALLAEGSRLGSAALLEKHRDFRGILSFALGYAFCEAIVQTGFTQANNVYICFKSYYSTDELADFNLFVQLSKNPAYVYFAIVERFSTVLLHIFATFLVFTGVVEKKKARNFLFALLAHIVFRLTGLAPVSYFPGNLGVFVATETVLLAMGLAAGYYALTRGTLRLEVLLQGDAKTKGKSGKSGKAKQPKDKGGKGEPS